MKKILGLSILLFAFASLQASAQDCFRQENVEASYVEEEQSVVIPAYQVFVSPPVYDTVTQTIVVKEAATEEYITCLEDGVFQRCTREIPAVVEKITYIIEKIPAVYQTHQAVVKNFKVYRKARDGFIRTIPCL